MIVVDRLHPDDEASFRELGGLLLPMAREVAIVPVVPKDAAEETWRAIAEGNTFIARIGPDGERGKIAGVLSIVKGPNYWYNHSRYFFIDHVFFVASEQRFALVGVKLLRAARDLVEPKGEAIFVRVANPRRRQKGTSEAFYATIAGFLPVGHLSIIRKPTVAQEPVPA